MSGITGILSPHAHHRDSSTLDRMLKSLLSKRDSIAGSIDEAPAVAGWVSQPGAVTERMPVWNAERTIALIFSGEEYQFVADGNFARIIDAYEKSGIAGFERLNGWFSGLLIDLRKRAATLFNDRYGMGRIYYYAAPEAFYFSSTAKSILAIHPSTRELNEQSLAEYMSVGCVLQNRTLFKDIHLLPPASAWTFHLDGQFAKAKYFDPATWEQQERLSPQAYSEQLRDVFSKVVPRYLSGPQRAALSLTGGLDSRMVLAWAKATPGTLPCYTFGGTYRDCADVTIARELARINQQMHSIVTFSDDFFKEFGALAEETIRVSDGTMDVSGAVELYMNRKANAIAPVRITGNYGSEILRSNVAFRPRTLDRSLYTSEFDQQLNGAEETYREEAKGHRLSFIAFKQVPWHHYSRYSVEKSVLTPRSPFLDNDLVALAYRVPQALETRPEPILQLIAEGDASVAAVASDRALQHQNHSPIAAVRRTWHEFTAKAEYAYDYGMPKWLVKSDRVLSKLALERLFLGRHKFYHFRIWYSRQLAGFARDLPLENRELGCYREGMIGKMIKDHTERRANHTLDLHRAASVAGMSTLVKTT